MFIEFSGTVEQIAEAFHTEIDSLVVDGQPHIANLTDPQIPAELAKTVVGIFALHDFMPHSMKKDRGAVKRDPVSGAWSVVKPSPNETFPTYGGECAANADCASGTCNLATGICKCTTSTQCSATLSGAAASCNTTAQTCVQCQTNADCLGPATCNTSTNVCQQTFLAVTPADFATIYNLNPLFAEGITGAGQTVVVIEDTLLTSVSDVATFRTAFGLSGTGQLRPDHRDGHDHVQQLRRQRRRGRGRAGRGVGGRGGPGRGDRAGVLRGHDDRVRRAHRAREPDQRGDPAPESSASATASARARTAPRPTRSYVSTYQQAAALGVSVFVSSGDEGAASCDADKTVATHGIAVSGFASTPYNVAVGGTDFGDYYNSQNGGPAQSAPTGARPTRPPFGSALSYIPEIPWNDSCASKLIYSTPAVALGTYTQAYGAAGFCNSTVGKADFRTTGAGSGGPSSLLGAAHVADGRRRPAHQVGRHAQPAGRLALRGQRGLRSLPASTA